MTNISSGIKIHAVRVSNFKCLENIEVNLDDLTILVGTNNAGKTSFLEALNLLVGTARRPYGADDIFVSAQDTSVPKTRVAIVDVLIRPVDDHGAHLDAFPTGSYWTELWGTGISQDANADDFVAMRGKLEWNPFLGEYRVNRVYLKEWKPFAAWLTAAEKEKVSGDHLEPLGLYYMDAKRDLDEDFRRTGSFWRKLTDDLGLSPADIQSLEASLSQLNSDIVSKSEVLKYIKTQLKTVKTVLAGTTGEVDITPVSRKLGDLSKGMNVTFSSSGNHLFALAKHGMGTRSLGALMIFKTYSMWKKLQAEDQGNKVHVFLGLEEPEAHLHPQAQRSLFSQIRSIPGQKIVSTHSPYFAGQVPVDNIRSFISDGQRTKVNELDTSSLTPDEITALNQKVMMLRGEMLFAKALMFFEGETEETALPVWAQEYWGKTIHELGFSFIGVSGQNYYPFIWLAQNLGIKWFILSDGEPAAINAVTAQVRKLTGNGNLAQFQNVIVIPSGDNFEKALIAEGYLAEVEAAFNKVFGVTDFLGDYITQHHGGQGRGGVTRNYQGPGGRERAAVDALEGNKTRIAREVAAQISANAAVGDKFPSSVEALFGVISQELRLSSDAE